MQGNSTFLKEAAVGLSEKCSFGKLREASQKGDSVRMLTIPCPGPPDEHDGGQRGYSCDDQSQRYKLHCYGPPPIVASVRIVNSELSTDIAHRRLPRHGQQKFLMTARSSKMILRYGSSRLVPFRRSISMRRCVVQ